MNDRLNLLTVCSHNRTRSVMMMVMLQHGLDARLGEGAAVVRSLGFGPEGLPPIPAAVAAMRRRGFDTSNHLSRQLTRDNVETADLVLTAERDHVIRIAALSTRAYRRSMTLPEFLTRAEFCAPESGVSLRHWVAGLTSDRNSREYIGAGVEEIHDPTGSSPRVFERAVVDMEEQCARAVALIARVVDRPIATSRFDVD